MRQSSFGRCPAVFALSFSACFIGCTPRSFDGDSSGPSEDDTSSLGADSDVPGPDLGASTLEVTNAHFVASEFNHLAGWLHFETATPSTANVTVTDNEGRVRTFASSGPQTDHAILLYGLRPQTINEIEIEATDGDGSTGMASFFQSVGPLPPDFPPLTATGHADGDPDAWTFFNVMRWAGPVPDQTWGMVIAVDAEGEVVWYRELPSAGDVSVTPGGRIFALEGSVAAVELDLAGAMVDASTAPGMSPALDSMHHEFQPDADGTFWTLTSQLRQIDGFDDGSGGTTSYLVVGDAVAHLDASGNVLTQWSYFDLVPEMQHTIGEGFHAPFWDAHYADEVPQGGTKDWSHANAVEPDPQRGLVLTSSRNLDCIVGVDADSGERRWALGHAGDFTLAEGDWFYHAHAPEVQVDGRILLYDNGEARPGHGFVPGLPHPYTRVVEYEIDEQTMTARETWSWQATPPRFAVFLGDADRLDSGNVLVTDGGLMANPAGVPYDPTNTKYAIIEEVSPATGDAIFTIRVGGPEASTSYSVYRSERATP